MAEPRVIHINPWGWVTRPAAVLLFGAGMLLMWCIDHGVHDWRMVVAIAVGAVCFLFCAY